jgi:hypothetical protein
VRLAGGGRTAGPLTVSEKLRRGDAIALPARTGERSRGALMERAAKPPASIKAIPLLENAVFSDEAIKNPKSPSIGASRRALRFRAIACRLRNGGRTPWQRRECNGCSSIDDNEECELLSSGPRHAAGAHGTADLTRGAGQDQRRIDRRARPTGSRGGREEVRDLISR